MAKSSPTLAPGARVVVRDEEWMVMGAAQAMGGRHAVKVIGLSELVRGHEKVFLTSATGPDIVQELRPEETELVTDDTPGYRRSRLYLEALLRRTPPTDDALYIGHKAAIDIKKYQLQPAGQALGALRPRILMADGVGLGKTIEVGILLSELIKRGRGDRILVVAIKSMLTQLQQELWARFAIGLVRLDSVGIQRVRAKIPANKNPFYHFNRAIISIDTLKNDGQYRHYLEQCTWDAIVVDEAHNVANSDTQRSRLASLLARTCDSLILTSATPHNGKKESFANLINMIDPTAVADPSNYTYQDIKGLYSRRFKKDIAQEVEGSFTKRNNKQIRVEASQPENDVFDVLSDLRFSTFSNKRRSGRDALFQTTLLKAFLSSPAACLDTIDARVRRLEKAIEDGKGDPDKLRDDRGKLKSLRRDVERVDESNFSKYGRLIDVLKKLGWKGTRKSPRVIVFSERRRTLEWLAEHLRERFDLKEGVLRVFHAGMPDVDQQTVVEDFGKRDNPVRILLASDVASEGVNLHFYCHDLVHFDIPWSLITLEQRNGRIDRYGQQHESTIRYLLTVSGQPSIKADLRIVERLVEKAQTVEITLGDAATAMGLYDAQKEEDAIATAIEDGSGPEQVLPDEEPEVDFLALLEREDDDRDASAEVPIGDTLSLYESTLQFAKAAFDEVLEGTTDIRAPQWHPDEPSCTFYAPEDLQRRCHQLPREAIPQGWEFSLSYDKTRVTDAIEKARTKKKEWPQVGLLWEQHPLMQWLVDRVLVRYGRHEAPVVIDPRMAKSTAALVFQGVLSNKHSQPVIVEWFATVFDGRSLNQILPLDNFIEETGFLKGLSNPGRGSNRHDALVKLIGPAVSAARKHMASLQKSRGTQLGEALRKDARRLRKWYDAAMALLEKQEEKSRGGRGKLPKHLAEKYKRRRQTLTGWRDGHDTWIQDTFHAVPTPYIRLALVLAGE